MHTGLVIGSLNNGYHRSNQLITMILKKSMLHQVYFNECISRVRGMHFAIYIGKLCAFCLLLITFSAGQKEVSASAVIGGSNVQSEQIQVSLNEFVQSDLRLESFRQLMTQVQSIETLLFTHLSPRIVSSNSVFAEQGWSRDMVVMQLENEEEREFTETMTSGRLDYSSNTCAPTIKWI